MMRWVVVEKFVVEKFLKEQWLHFTCEVDKFINLLLTWSFFRILCTRQKIAVICLGRGADLHMAQLTPLPLTISCSSKSRLVLPFWYRLTRIVPDKGPLKGCSSVVVCEPGVHFWLSYLRKICNITFLTHDVCTCTWTEFEKILVDKLLRN